MTTASEILTQDDLAAELGIAPRTLGQWRYHGIGPNFVRVGKLIRYRRQDVDAWLAEQVVTPATS